MSGAHARTVHPNTRIAKVNLTIATATEWTPKDGANPTPSTETELMHMAGFVQKPASAVMLCHLEQLQPNPHHDVVLTIEGPCCVIKSVGIA